MPSLTLDPGELQKLSGSSYYEERLLFLLIRLRNPRANVVYVTSMPVHPLTLDYYLHLLAGVPASHARARLTMLCTYDASSRPLTQKILERPRLLQRIRYAVHDRGRAYLTVFNSTPLERKLAVLLGVPLNGLDPAQSEHGTKSGSRRIFREAGVAMPDGVEDVRSQDDVATALVDLAETEAESPPRAHQAERQLLGRGQRARRLPGPIRPRRDAPCGGSRGDAGVDGTPVALLRQAPDDGWRRRGVSSRRRRRHRRARSSGRARWAR